MKYIRTKDGVYTEEKYKVAKAFVSTLEEYQAKIMPTAKTNFDIINQADTIEELIQVGDIVFYWTQSDDTERCEVIVREDDIRRVRFNTLTKLLIPIGDNYVCVAKANSVFVTFGNRRYLQMKKELELL